MDRRLTIHLRLFFLPVSRSGDMPWDMPAELTTSSSALQVWALFASGRLLPEHRSNLVIMGLQQSLLQRNEWQFLSTVVLLAGTDAIDLV
jgi:hypothetical protein